MTTYRHGQIGVYVDRLVPSPKRICRHSWSSVKVTIWEDWLSVPAHDLTLIRYQRALVAVLRHETKSKAIVAGWNGVRRRIFVRVYQGRGKKADHDRFHVVEKIVHANVQLSIKRLNDKLKRIEAELP